MQRRRAFLVWASFLPLAGLWRALSTRHAARPRAARRLEVALPVPEGLSLHGPVGVVREGDTLAAFSLRCAHLGCTVRSASEGGLVCPCHGSRYDARGELVRGPAREGLRPLASHMAGETLIVDLPS